MLVFQSSSTSDSMATPLNGTENKFKTCVRMMEMWTWSGSIIVPNMQKYFLKMEILKKEEGM